MLVEMIRAYNARGKTILLTTHNMEEADMLCDRVAVVDHGKVIALGTPQKLKLLRVHVLSVGRTGAVPDPRARGIDQSSRLRE